VGLGLPKCLVGPEDGRRGARPRGRTLLDLGRNAAQRRGSVRRLFAALPLLLFTGCRFGAPPGGTSQGQDISRLYQVLFYVAIPIAVIVYGLIFWSLLRYRRN